MSPQLHLGGATDPGSRQSRSESTHHRRSVLIDGEALEVVGNGSSSPHSGGSVRPGGKGERLGRAKGPEEASFCLTVGPGGASCLCEPVSLCVKRGARTSPAFSERC